MKSKIIFILLFAVALPAHAVQKCTDSEGRITYADFCPASVPSKVENLYIPDTYDPEAALITQENYRGMEESTRQSEYDRAQRNAKIRRENTLPDTPSSTASNVGGSGSSRPSRALRSGSSFDEQFSAALKSKLDLQKSKTELLNRQHTNTGTGGYLPKAGNGNIDSEYKYESSSGTKYKYDLSNPSDRLLYEVDPAAQLMDEINPMVDIDRGLDQYGGGAKW